MTPVGKRSFVFEDRPPVHCQEYETFAEEAEPGDYLLCPFWGVIYIADVTVEERDKGSVVELTDLKGRGHMYAASAIIRIAREDEDAGEPDLHPA